MSDPIDTVVHVVDDDESMRTALTRLLTQAGYRVKAYSSAGEFLVAEPDVRSACLILDLELPGPGGLELQHALHRLGREMPIVFISAHRDIPSTVQAIKAGARDFLLKPINTQMLLAAVESAVAVTAPESPPESTAEPFATPLTDRERAVLRGVVTGRLNKQIAAELALSERTIKTCRAHLMHKLNAHSLAELVRLAEPIFHIGRSRPGQIAPTGNFVAPSPDSVSVPPLRY
ncbi:two component transcriptional regulator, LuxR family [Paraburkholderia fungorum]|uniref:Two component transcriptional regulator, LuxR family n=1 Tax=Paraburkholderia fungorum TaxID=134537 RepID=A0A1H1I7E1_9BURK|nr:response regulator [Paraburkholderia fungorum]SDR33479.1 two component transcriptional regulator, LuxR family [Paraburkholderia fungorum]